MKLIPGDKILLLPIQDIYELSDYVNEYNELVFEDVENDFELLKELLTYNDTHIISEVDEEGSFRVEGYIHPNYWFSHQIVKKIISNDWI